MTKKQRAAAATELLKQEYPDAICSLNYSDPFQLLCATRLSAQCTDARVNIVTPALFAEFPTAKAMADAPIERVEELIASCREYREMVELQKLDDEESRHEKEGRANV